MFETYSLKSFREKVRTHTYVQKERERERNENDKENAINEQL